MQKSNKLKFIWISPFGLLVNIRINEISKRLTENNIMPIILTHKLRKEDKVSPKFFHEKLCVIHFRNPLLYNFKSKILNYIREVIFKVAFFLRGFPLLFSDVNSFIKKNKNIKFVYATGPSFFTHILGYLLKKKFHLPLVIEYTDPWYLNPYAEGKIRWLQKQIDYIIERQILDSAEIIVSLSDFLNSILKANFPFIRKKPIFSIPDGLNLHDISYELRKKEQKIIITYTGSIYGRRDISPLFKIISDLNKEDFFKDTPLLIKIFGNYPKNVFERILRRLNIRDLFYLGDFLPRDSALEEIKNCDLALHIGENLDYPTTAFKVWEYLSCRKKILFLNPENTFRSNFIENNQLGFIIPINDLEKAKSKLKMLLSDLKNGAIDSYVEESKLSEFSWENRAQRFLNTIMKIILK
ncbi:MAG: hypothetical protein ACFFBH_14745 [Promethearchaeota archaeon]